ncbi:hypothetical protein G6F18_014235 [Rhizopus arrhizus]|nr:hypothetical protein G6F18_014235 [Rhizopus arrhizus]
MGVGEGDEEDKAAVPTKGPKGRPSETRAPGPGGPEGDTDNTEVVVAEAAERSRAGNVTPVLGTNGSETLFCNNTDTETSSNMLANKDTKDRGAEEASIDCHMIRRSTVS